MPNIETARLSLRMLGTPDLEDFYRLLSNPLVVRYVGSGLPLTRDETETTLASILSHWERHGFGRLAVIDKATGEFIGFAGLRMLIDTPEVVYHIRPEFWGRGLATEMGHAILRYGFEAHAFARIVAIAKPENSASIRVMQKIGMQYEKHTAYYGIDVVQYAISRELFRPHDAAQVMISD